jgi:phosphohistidine phosphatase SixA
MTARFEAHPPDYVLLVGGSHNEWNVPYFGSDPGDGAEVMDWIRKNYQGVMVIGHEPLRDDQFGLEFLKHAPPPAGVTADSPKY